MTLRIAMWSGPRNISTAMMRAFSQRPHTVASDEPLYAAYLQHTGLNHPMRQAILTAQPTDWSEVTKSLVGEPPGGAEVWYQKHMSQHLLPGMPLDWTDGLSNCFLIREPAEVLSSYLKARGTATLEDLGYPQQVELFERIRRRTGRTPPVVDARDVLENPRRMLSLLCESLRLPFLEQMLSWPAGPHVADGVWAPHWYAAVWGSTGFGASRPLGTAVPSGMEALVEAARVHYRQLHVHRLGA